MVARRVNPIAVLVVLAVVPAVALGALWRFADARRPPPVVQPTPPDAATLPDAMTTPLLSVRRAPGVLSREVNVTALQNALQPLLASVDDNRCFALAVDGQRVAAKNETLPLSPASNLKILTAAVALDVLGPGFTYSTKVVGTVGADGVVAGDLYLVGGGDPVLASEWWNGLSKYPPFNETSFESLADAIQQHGVTKIDGKLVGDGSRYDDEYFAPTWANADHITEAGPIDALLANDSWQTPQDAAKDPALGAASVLRDQLAARGISVGDVATGVSPGGATIAEVQSQPLPAILAEMLTTSDNNSAEMILKEIGYAAKGQGTRMAGLQVVMEKLAAWGVPTAGVNLVDGSGLSDANRLTCAAILGVLEHGSANDPVGQGMPVAGAAGGTLVDVFADTPLAGRLHGKTGSLNPNCNPGQLGAKSLGGYVPETGGGAIEFVLLQNGECIAKNYRPLWDQLGAALAPYPTGPLPRRLHLDDLPGDEPLMAVMPMFPLGTVLLPGAVLPLHVFEPRYQQLVRDCLDAPEHEFGVVLIDRGSEVGGGESRLVVGVVAEMVQVAGMEGGRFAVVSLGTRRIRVIRWLPDDPYPRAEVEDWPDEDGDVSVEQIEATASRVRRCVGLAVEMGDRTGVPEVEISGDPSVDTFLLSAISPLGPADQYSVLCAPDPATRLELIDQLLDDAEAGLRFRLG